VIGRSAAGSKALACDATDIQPALGGRQTEMRTRPRRMLRLWNLVHPWQFVGPVSDEAQAIFLRQNSNGYVLEVINDIFIPFKNKNFVTIRYCLSKDQRLRLFLNIKGSGESRFREVGVTSAKALESSIDEFLGREMRS
jgi:hypothetical protein